MLCCNLDEAVKMENFQLCFVLAAFDMDFTEKSLPLDIPAPYDDMEYSPDGFLLQD